jgi:hypothetical protein
MFYAESLYLNSPKRIMALIMVMSLSLLVYSLLERKLRKGLKSQKLAIASQVNKPTDNPTIRWVFQCFEDIAIYKIEEDTPRAANMDDQNETVLKALGPPTKKYIFSLGGAECGVEIEFLFISRIRGLKRTRGPGSGPSLTPAVLLTLLLIIEKTAHHKTFPGVKRSLMAH